MYIIAWHWHKSHSHMTYDDILFVVFSDFDLNENTMLNIILGTYLKYYICLNKQCLFICLIACKLTSVHARALHGAFNIPAYFFCN
jgi:hypothetical protein